MIPLVIIRRMFIPLCIHEYYSLTFVVLSSLAFPFVFAELIGVDMNIINFIIELTIGIIFVLILITFGKSTENQNYSIVNFIIIIIGLIDSLYLLFFLAIETIELLISLSVILDVNHTILGIILLGIGNSISDFISNINITKQGFPEMALSSCFSTPVFQLLVGLGIGLIIRLYKFGNQNLIGEIESGDLTLMFLSMFFLLLSIISITIIIPFTSYKYTKYCGIYLIIIYLIYIIISLLRTFNILQFDIKFI